MAANPVGSSQEMAKFTRLTAREQERRGWHFDHLQRTLPGLSGQDHMLLFDALPSEVQEVMWSRLQQETDDRRYADGLIDFPKRTPAIPTLRAVPTRRPALPPAADPLKAVSPPAYFRALAGTEVPDRGGVIRCCLPGHDDRTPSLRVWADPDRGFHCFGCGRGGTIYDLGRELTGISDRGPGFIELRDWIAERVLGASYREAVA